MEPIIKVNNLTKSYKSQTVLNALNWEVKQGDIVGLLGRNGVGKSTLLKSILNISEVESGSVTLFDENFTALSSSTKAKIGYVPQENDEISWLSVKDLICFRKHFYKQWSDEKVASLIERWEIDENKTVSELSPGQMQRVLIILALAPMPSLILFDEPAAALDPAARREFLKEIVTLASEEQITIVFSTHIVSDLERVANKVAILNEGKICYFDDLDTTKENVVQLSIQHEGNFELEVPNVLRSKNMHNTLQCVVSKLDETWLEAMHTAGLKIEIIPMGLEDIFLELTL
jgi:ABC-2 type transport system ATP-binding protein